MVGKTTALFICVHKRVKQIIFALSIKFCYESGLAILHLIRLFPTLVYIKSSLFLLNKKR